MRWIQLGLTFAPDQVMMSRLAKRGTSGVWRVWSCAEVGNPLIIRVDDYKAVGADHYPDKVLRIMAARPYRRGVMVDPRKIALEFLESAAADRERIDGILVAMDRANRAAEDCNTIYFGKAA